MARRTTDSILVELTDLASVVNDLRARLEEAKAARDRLMVEARDSGITFSVIAQTTGMQTGSAQASINRTRDKIALEAPKRRRRTSK